MSVFEQHTTRIVPAFGRVARACVYWDPDWPELSRAFEEIEKQIADLIPPGYRFGGGFARAGAAFLREN